MSNGDTMGTFLFVSSVPFASFISINVIQLGQMKQKETSPLCHHCSQKESKMLEDKVLKTIKKYDLIKTGDTIVVGVSGGPDSMALLNALINLNNKNLSYKLIVAHINHGIREEADSETEFVRSYCEKKGIPCYAKKEDVIQIAKKQKIGTEEAGRNLRYEFFEQIVKQENAKKIATAHNANDNAETVLMNIIRGSGTSGLKGIEAKRDNKYIRPLIECTRNEIEEYCKIQNLNPRYDKTNEENIYTRNKVRNILIPLLEKEFNPSVIESLNRISEIAKEENKYIEKQVKNIYEEIKLKEEKQLIELDLKKFNNEELVIKNRLVLYTINKLQGSSQNIEKIHIRDIVKLCNNNIGNKYLTPNKNLKITVNKGKIFFEKII